MLTLFKHSAKTKLIRCPHCFFEQEVSLNAISAYCKNCRRRIDIKGLIQTHQTKPSAQNWRVKTKTVLCPICHSEQEVLANAISIYCKNCHQRIGIQKTEETELKRSSHLLEQKQIICPYCKNPQNVPSTALSTSCSECGNRINLQNYQIRGKFRGQLQTKGTVYIAADGNVEGNIDTWALIIAGRFKGEIIAEHKIELKPTARLFGKIISPALIILPGAVFVGQSHIVKEITSEKQTELIAN